jgi:anti-sigma factor RsiW
MRRLISVYLDGELDKERERDLFSHLEVCPECREEMAAQRALTSVVGRALAREDVPDVLADVLAALERKKERRSHGFGSVLSWSPRPALAYAAAAAFGIALGVLIFSSAGTTTAAAASDPLPIAYLSEKPPNSLVTFYLGDTVGGTDE